MNMDIYWTPECTFWFDVWTTSKTDKALFALSCIATFVGILLIHLVKKWRLDYIEKCKFGKGRYTKGETWLATVLHGFVYFLEAMAMLLVMTYNGYLIIVIVIAQAVGYMAVSKEYDHCCSKVGNTDDYACH